MQSEQERHGLFIFAHPHLKFSSVVYKQNRRAKNSALYSPKKQKYDEHENDKPQSAAGVISPTLAVWPCRQGTQSDQEQNHNEYGYHLCIHPLSRSPSEVGSGASTSARALDIGRG
jgi:hypothetical protein